MLAYALLLVVARTGTVRIHLTDGHNRPIAHHKVWLAETNSSKPVRPFGVQWGIPKGPYHGVTNKNGGVAIPGVPLRKPMMVVVKFGPRFDAFVAKNGNSSGGSLDAMKFEGAVYAGKSAHVILAEDREITGTVTDAGGKPLKDVEVALSDTGFGHMGGYPGTTLDVQKTDGRGMYRFTRLPNCSFLMTADAAEGMALESRVEKGPWEFLAIIGQFWTSQSVLLSKPSSRCDFRISQTAQITVIFKGTPAEFKGWTASVSPHGGGQDIGYSPSSSTLKSRVLPGPVTVWLTRDAGQRSVVAKKLTLKPGESRTIQIVLADLLAGKSRP